MRGRGAAINKELFAVRCKKVRLGVDLQERHRHGYAAELQCGRGEAEETMVQVALFQGSASAFLRASLFLMLLPPVPAGCASLYSSLQRYQAEAARDLEPPQISINKATMQDAASSPLSWLFKLLKHLIYHIQSQKAPRLCQTSGRFKSTRIKVQRRGLCCVKLQTWMTLHLSSNAGCWAAWVIYFMTLQKIFTLRS